MDSWSAAFFSVVSAWALRSAESESNRTSEARVMVTDLPVTRVSEAPSTEAVKVSSATGSGLLSVS